MKAVILAAGFGNRMKPLTNELHKTLLTVADKKVIDRIIDGLLDNQVLNIVVVTGYRADELKNYLVIRYEGKCKFQFVHNPRYRETNNIFSLALAFEEIEIDQDIILIESDLIYEAGVIKKVIESPFSNVALVDHYKTGMDGTVVSLSGNLVTSVIPPHLQGPNFDFSDKYKTLNIYKFSKDFCNKDFKKILTYYSRTIDDNCYYELILGLLIYMQREGVYAEVVQGLKWTEVDDPNDLRLAEFVFNKEEKYTILEKSWGGLWSYPVIDFCFIRNMYFPPSSVVSEFKNNLEGLIHNYGSSQAILNEKLAYFTYLPKENIALLNGAAQVYPILKNYFKNKSASVPFPTFGEYTKLFTESKAYEDNGNDYYANLQNSIIKDDSDIVVIVNPNNPTGTTLNTKDIFELIQLNKQKFFIIDESFIDFSSQKSIQEFLNNNVTNVLVIKSLSKVLGVPGIRLGYVFTYNKDVLSYVNDNLPVWNINSFAEFYLEIILKHRNTLQKSFEKTIGDREEFRTQLAELSNVATVFPSGGNFILVKLKNDKSEIAPLLKNLVTNHSIYVKDVSNKFKDGSGYLRVAVRLPNENALLVEKLKMNFN